MNFENIQKEERLTIVCRQIISGLNDTLFISKYTCHTIPPASTTIYFVPGWNETKEFPSSPFLMGKYRQ